MAALLLPWVLLVLLGSLLPGQGLQANPMLASEPSRRHPAPLPGGEPGGITAAPPPATAQEMHPLNKQAANHSGEGHQKHRKAFPVLDIDYDRIRIPFEISLWILLACLMKLGRSAVVLGDGEGSPPRATDPGVSAPR